MICSWKLICGDWLVTAGIMLYMFVVGACAGSFLNVVIHRLPRGVFLSERRSFCTSCGKFIPLRENLPLISWFMLRGKCRGCGARISPRYVIIEFLTAAFLALLYYFYFSAGTISFSNSQTNFVDFFAGGWWLYLSHAVLFCCLIAASAIDLEMYLIPMSLCIFAAIFGLLTAAAAPFFIDYWQITEFQIFPYSSLRFSGLIAGGGAGILAANILLDAGIIKPSYEGLELEAEPAETQENISENPGFNDRREVLKEFVFLIPIVLFALAGWKLLTPLQSWQNLAANPHLSCLLGAAGGYLTGAGIVWLTRILGTLAFGREAMGLGDVHLMGAIGVFCGALPSIIIFFAAPFFGLAFTVIQLITKKNKEIPYGPFLSLAAVFVIIFREAVFEWLSNTMGFAG
ncbi:Leader peptidase PppA [Sedimentisphaera cyanobacteriorum]|uniref:Leader peptidase PppA n=1 Tax=Sedimentisphaera cyanobacteriorum TaxID=1940790 RepID=A0A1Q2HM49_9BACT|nr:Leader peptidase PppA [Sedimentisphaera cyanobacteriorum]